MNTSFWKAGHAPTLFAAFLYFDLSFMIWYVLGPMGVQIAADLQLTTQQRGMMVATPILAGAVLRFLMGILADRTSPKTAGLIGQVIVIGALFCAWQLGIHSYEQALLLGLFLGFAGASFAVSLPLASQWYPPEHQGKAMGIAGAGNSGTVFAALLALGLPIYTGYDLTVHQSRPVWNTPVIPVLFVAMAIASGSAVGALLAGGHEGAQRVLRQYLMWSCGAVGVMLISILGTTSYGGSAQELTFLILTTGTMGLIFVGAGIVAGTAAPIALLLAPFGRQQVGIALAALLVLLGGAALRYALLMGPQQLQTLY